MNKHVVLLSIPGLRDGDVARMPRLQSLMADGGRATLVPSFPCVTWPVQANMLTGKRADEHGVVANGFYWRDDRRVEMWTAWNEKITSPQIWDRLHDQHRGHTSAVWFPMLSKGCGADFICMPAPIHNPDGSESLWCYTRPVELYGELRDRFGHFPLQHFWGPLAGIQASEWIAETAVYAAARHGPNLFTIYLPHLDYAAQRDGPDSEAAQTAVLELDQVIGRLGDGFQNAVDEPLLFLAASEYVITAVDHVAYPNRVLREAGLLRVRAGDTGEHLDFENSAAWALVDHQCAHVFVQETSLIPGVADLFRGREGFSEVIAGSERNQYHLNHPRSGEVVLMSTPNSWQAYYWWLDDALAPDFARTVDIHRKPGYDPVELFFDRSSRSTPLNASLVRGSHGAAARDPSQQGVLLSSQSSVIRQPLLADYEVAGLVLAEFGI